MLSDCLSASICRITDGDAQRHAAESGIGAECTEQTGPTRTDRRATKEERALPRRAGFRSEPWESLGIACLPATPADGKPDDWH